MKGFFFSGGRKYNLGEFSGHWLWQGREKEEKKEFFEFENKKSFRLSRISFLRKGRRIREDEKLFFFPQIRARYNALADKLNQQIEEKSLFPQIFFLQWGHYFFARRKDPYNFAARLHCFSRKNEKFLSRRQKKLPKKWEH